MSRVFLLSDPHLGHTKMAIKRGFESVGIHDATIIENWNKVVKKKDTVFLLGDITFEKNDYALLSLLRGTIHVVGGNHDLRRDNKELLRVVNTISGAIDYKGCCLTHIPIHPRELEYYRANIHGHTHEININHYKYINVSCEAVNYTPQLFEDLMLQLESRDKNQEVRFPDKG